MADTLRMFVLAGEPSGDRLAGDLIRTLQQTTDVDLSGVGGPALESVGLKSIFSFDDLSVMGLFDVLKRLPLLMRRERQTVAAILGAKPDLVLLVDSQTFSKRIAGILRDKGHKGPIILYVAPAAWAWKPRRATELRPLVNAVMAILPFEPATMQRLNGPPTTYVGHPAARNTIFTQTNPDRGSVALFPGSRPGELRRHLPLFERLVAALVGHPKVTDFIVPTLPGLAKMLGEATANWAAPVQIITSETARNQALKSTVAAVACSGTVTLELALAGIPMTVLYVPDAVQHYFYKRLGRPMIALPNIMLGQRVIDECQPGPTLFEDLLSSTRDLLDHPKRRKEQRTAFSTIRQMIEDGDTDAPRRDPAEVVLEVLRSARNPGSS